MGRLIKTQADSETKLVCLVTLSQMPSTAPRQLQLPTLEPTLLRVLLFLLLLLLLIVLVLRSKLPFVLQ